MDFVFLNEAAEEKLLHFECCVFFRSWILLFDRSVNRRLNCSMTLVL